MELSQGQTDKLSEALTRFSLADQLQKKYEAEKKEYRDKVAEIMHEIGCNEIIATDLNGKEWKGAYITSERSNVDYDLLLEHVGGPKYREIVTKKPSTYLKISAAPQKKESKSPLTSKAPKSKMKNPAQIVPHALG